MTTTPITYSIQDLYDGLVKHRLIIPTGVPGAFGRGVTFGLSSPRPAPLVRSRDPGQRRRL